jgi:hypothetical protein
VTPPPSPRAHELLATILTALVLSVVSAALCRAAAGVSLGLFFGGVAVATLLVPPLAAAERSAGRAVLVPAFVSLGVAVVWLSALGDLLRPNQWVACSAVLVAYACALAGACTLLAAARCNRPIAAGLVTVVGLLWLTWPVWLSAALVRPIGESLVGWLVPAHPLFAVNGVLPHFDSWDRYPLAYRQLTVLNQDVFYAMPTTVWPAVLVHAAIAVAALAAAGVVLRRGRRV